VETEWSHHYPFVEEDEDTDDDTDDDDDEWDDD